MSTTSSPADIQLNRSQRYRLTSWLYQAHLAVSKNKADEIFRQAGVIEVDYLSNTAMLDVTYRILAHCPTDQHGEIRQIVASAF